MTSSPTSPWFTVLLLSSTSLICTSGWEMMGRPTVTILLSLGLSQRVVIWGPSAIAWFVFEGLISLCAQFHHCNIDFPDAVERQLSKVLVTPRYHAAHHAVDRHFGDANFSTIFSFWDKLLGTYAAPREGGLTTLAASQLGLPEGRDLAFSAQAWLLEPFSQRNLHLPAADPPLHSG